MDKIDISDMSELLFKGSKRNVISNWACYEQGTACRVKPPPVPEVCSVWSVMHVCLLWLCVSVLICVISNWACCEQGTAWRVKPPPVPEVCCVCVVCFVACASVHVLLCI